MNIIKLNDQYAVILSDEKPIRSNDRKGNSWMANLLQKH